MHSLQGRLMRPLENRYRVELHVQSPFFKDSSVKKIRPITLIVWVLGKVEINAQKNVKIFLFCFEQISNCDTCFNINFFESFSKDFLQPYILP